MGAHCAPAPAAVPTSPQRGTRPLPAAISIPCHLMACPVASGTELRCCLKSIFYVCSSAKSKQALEKEIFSWPWTSSPLSQPGAGWDESRHGDREDGKGCKCSPAPAMAQRHLSPLCPGTLAQGIAFWGPSDCPGWRDCSWALGPCSQ